MRYIRADDLWYFNHTKEQHLRKKAKLMTSVGRQAYEELLPLTKDLKLEFRSKRYHLERRRVY
jgi:hypothetical protein